MKDIFFRLAIISRTIKNVRLFFGRNYFLFFFIVLIISFLPKTILANSSGEYTFIWYKCDTPGMIKDKKFFVLSSKRGLIKNRATGSPLLHKIPHEVGVSSLSVKMKFTNTIIVQDIPTKHLKGDPLEGGMLHKFKSNNIYLFIDNALNEDVYFELDNLKPVKIPALSQKSVNIEQGTRNIKILRCSDNKVLETSKLKASKLVGKKREDGRFGKYIYNIMGKNTYRIKFGTYK